MGNLWVGTDMGLAFYPLLITVIVATLAVALAAFWPFRGWNHG